MWRENNILSCLFVAKNKRIEEFYSKNEEFKNIPLTVYKTIESTNSHAKLLAVQYAEHRTTIIAEEQTKGTGRFGRSFFSPSDSGIYMSIILKP